MVRPRKVTSQAILEIAYHIVMEEGPQSLTFSRLGEKVGLVPAALAKRFKNKKQLLAEVDRYALARSNDALQVTMMRYDSPLEAIIAGLKAEMSFAGSIQGFINGQSFLLIDLADPDLYANYKVSFHKRQQQIIELLKQAQKRGELSENADSAELAVLLQTIQQGSGHVWAMSQQGTIDTYIDRYVRMALKPYIKEE